MERVDNLATLVATLLAQDVLPLTALKVVRG